MSRLFIQIWVYIWPLPLVVAMYFIWAAWSKDHVFTFYVMLLPIFYGYVARDRH